jgi:hypothetical protein
MLPYQIHLVDLENLSDDELDMLQKEFTSREAKNHGSVALKGD